MYNTIVSSLTVRGITDLADGSPVDSALGRAYQAALRAAQPARLFFLGYYKGHGVDIDAMSDEQKSAYCIVLARDCLEVAHEAAKIIITLDSPKRDEMVHQATGDIASWVMFLAYAIGKASGAPEVDETFHMPTDALRAEVESDRARARQTVQ